MTLFYYEKPGYSFSAACAEMYTFGIEPQDDLPTEALNPLAELLDHRHQE